MDMSLSKLRELVMDWEAGRAGDEGVVPSVWAGRRRGVAEAGRSGREQRRRRGLAARRGRGVEKEGRGGGGA